MDNTEQTGGPARPLRRSTDGRLIAGVADGLARHFDFDVTLVRVGFVALSIFGGVGIPAYLACWLLIPEAGHDRSMAEDLLGGGPYRSLLRERRPATLGRVWLGARRPWGYRERDRDRYLRVSDAERNQVAETLSRHCAEGRLDLAEFEERLARVMAAKTRADLAPLLADLPSLPAPHPPPGRRRRHQGTLLVLVLGLLLVFTLPSLLSPARWVGFFHVPWLLVLILVLLVWRRGRGRGYRHQRQLGASSSWPGPD